ncbi:MAG: hypothetical protein ACTSRN_00955 [Alphaproteobacteria bacterium]
MTQGAIQALAANIYAVANTYNNAVPITSDRHADNNWEASNFQRIMVSGEGDVTPLFNTHSNQILSAPMQTTNSIMSRHNWICEALTDMMAHADTQNLPSLKRTLLEARFEITKKLDTTQA